MRTLISVTFIALLIFRASAQEVKIFTDENGKQGLKNQKEAMVIKPAYDYLYIFVDGVVAANKGGRVMDENANADGGKWTFFGYDGKPLTTESYDNARPLVAADDNKYIAVNKGCSNADGYYCNGGLWGLMDKNGQEIVPLKYKEIQAELVGGETMVAYVKMNDKYGYIDASNGQPLTPLKYDEAYLFRWNKTANVRIGDKWGVVNSTGKEIIPVIYDEISIFYNGKVEVKQGDRTFFIDENGIEVK